MGRLPFDLEIEDIEALADIVKAKDLGEIRLEDEDIGAKIVIKSNHKPPKHAPHMMPAMMPAAVPAAAQSAAPAAQAPSAPAPSSASGNEVKSPLVGTFYSAPAPGKAPFVTVGQKVKKGDVIMIIESMKLMNEIQSDFDGEVKEILVSNGEAVEFDQTIMIIG